MTPEILSFIKGMEKAGRFAAQTLQHVGKAVRPGISTAELDALAEDFVRTAGHRSAPLGYHGFPKSICTSVNEVICHGIPDPTVLKEGDIVNVDVTPIVNGYHGDTSATFFVGNVSDAARRITECARAAMEKGIEAIEVGGTTGDIGFAINKYVTKMGFFVVKEIGGHGIGQKFHDEPFVPSYGKKGRGDPLKPWRCITVEPMINETGVAIKEISIPGSSIKYYRTGDGTLSAQFEHTVLVTDSGYEIMTLLD